jgi:hypothetical protein
MKKNPENEKKIASLISEMTLEEKVLQMFQISNVAEYPEGTYEKFVEAGAGSFLHVLGKDADAVRDAAAKTRMKIPPIFGIDAIHGHAFLNGAVVFPTQLGMACSWNEELIEKMGQATAEEVNADGLDWVFSPVLCLARDTRWGRVDETFGEDTYLTGRVPPSSAAMKKTGLSSPASSIISATEKRQAARIHMIPRQRYERCAKHFFLPLPNVSRRVRAVS